MHEIYKRKTILSSLEFIANITFIEIMGPVIILVVMLIKLMLMVMMVMIMRLVIRQSAILITASKLGLC